jgi:D-amino peptidase
MLHLLPNDQACDEAERELGDMTTYRTKTGTSRQSGLNKPPRKVNMELKDVLQAAIAVKDRCSSRRLEGPYELILHFLSTDLADGKRCDGTAVERLDGLRIAYRDTDLVRLLCKAF